MGNAEHKLIYERVDLVQNLNTTPLDITGLDGDKFDYFVEIEKQSSGSNEFGTVYFNNDETVGNYRNYEIKGQVSIASSAINDTTSSRIDLLNYTTGRNSITRFSITGNSDSKRYVSLLSSGQIVTSNRISKISGYWKNNIDKLTSLHLGQNNVSSTTTLTIRIYQIPKQSNLDNENLIEILEWSAESSTKSFTGLKGDTDEEYEIIWESTGSAGVSTNLSGSIYTEQDLKNSGGSLSASNSTSTTYVDGLYQNGTLNLKAKSGMKRLFTGSTAKTSSSQQSETACWVNNTLDEVDQINIIPSGSITAIAKLYKRKSNKSIDPVPMETAKVVDVADDFSTGQTISNIQGNRIEGAIKLEYTGVGNADIEVQFNSITSNSNQQLKSSGSSTTAVSTSPTKIKLCGGSSDTTNTNSGVMWIYPKSGQNRPCLNEQSYNSNILEKNAIWVNDDINEIISMTFTASNTNTMDGQIVCSYPKNTKQSSPSWT